MKSESPDARAARLASEKAFHVYWSALERGNLETCERILQQAESDPDLKRIIIEAHEHDNAEQDARREPAEQN